MSVRFTHFGIENGRVDLLAGDVTECVTCHRGIFRDHAFVSDADPETRGEPTSVEAQLARGRRPLPDGALRVDEGDRHCDYCVPEVT